MHFQLGIVLESFQEGGTTYKVYGATLVLAGEGELEARTQGGVEVVTLGGKSCAAHLPPLSWTEPKGKIAP